MNNLREMGLRRWRTNLLALAICMLIVTAGQPAWGMVRPSKRFCRPCGPEHMPPVLKWLIPQGVAGADFRAACAQHDRGYATPDACKSECDYRFLCDMLAQCESSRNPRRCARVARRMYRAVKEHGDRAFQRAQAEAFERASQ